MRLRRARTLVVTFVDSTPILRNYMTRHAVPVNSFALDLLSRGDHWQSPEDFCVVYAGVPPALIATYIRGFGAEGCGGCTGCERMPGVLDSGAFVALSS